MSCFLKKGSTGSKVLSVQKELKKLGYYKGALDGIYGDYTVAGVKSYQKAKNLDVDGCVGNQSWNSLFNVKTVVLKKASEIKITDPFLQRVAKAVGGPFSSYTGFHNRIMSEIYQKYLNDIYPQGEALKRLEKNQPLNCADFSQIGYAVAKAMKYEVRYVHMRCKSGLGHIILEVLGHEFKTWTKSDLAAAADNNYPLGKIWCDTGKPESYNDKWLLTDDGKT